MFSNEKVKKGIFFTRARVFVLSGLFLTMGVLDIVQSYFVFNGSKSMPVWVYRRISSPVSRHSIVGACVDESFAELALERGYLERGLCSTGVRPVMKYVVAVPGDAVEVLQDRIIVNGVTISASAVLSADSRNRKIPNHLGLYVLDSGEYWLHSDFHSGSFDSRYFGPVNKILGVVVPFVTQTELCQFGLLKKHFRC